MRQQEEDYSNMTRDIATMKWSDLKYQIHQHWAKLTDDDLSRLNGGAEELIMLLRKRYGYGKAQAEIEISKWLDEIGPRTMNRKKSS